MMRQQGKKSVQKTAEKQGVQREKHLERSLEPKSEKTPRPDKMSDQYETVARW